MAFRRFLKEFFKARQWATAAAAAPHYYVDLFSPPIPSTLPPANDDGGKGHVVGLSKRDRRRLLHGDPATDAELIAECEAYLCGDFRGYLQRRGQPVPGWAWMNGLAHGDLTLIRELAREGDADAGPRAVVANIAQQLLSLVECGADTLEGLQHRVLIPLESDLAYCPSPVVPPDAAQLSRAIKASLQSRILPRGDNNPGSHA